MGAVDIIGRVIKQVAVLRIGDNLIGERIAVRIITGKLNRRVITNNSLDGLVIGDWRRV